MAAPLTRHSSAVVSTRATNDSAAAFSGFCERRGISRAEGLRKLMARAGDADIDASALDKVKGALAALENGDREAAVLLLQEASAHSESAGDDTDALATEQTPETPPPDSTKPSKLNVRAAVAQLSSETLAAIRKRGMTPEQFVALRDKTTRSASEPSSLVTQTPAPPLDSVGMRAAVVGLSRETLASIQRKGLTPEEFITKRNRATRRY